MRHLTGSRGVVSFPWGVAWGFLLDFGISPRISQWISRWVVNSPLGCPMWRSRGFLWDHGLSHGAFYGIMGHPEDFTGHPMGFYGVVWYYVRYLMEL